MNENYIIFPISRLAKSSTRERVLSTYKGRACLAFNKSTQMFKSSTGWTNEHSEAEVRKMEDWLSEYDEITGIDINLYVYKRK